MRRLFPIMVTTVVFVVGFILCSVQFPNFASTRVVANLLTDNAFLGIVAVGMTFVIISGGIDLSVGSVIGFTTVFLAITIEHYAVPPLAAFAIILVICLLFGAAMGAVIHYFEMPAFIVTLAGMFLARGAAFLMSTESIPIKAPLYTDIGAYTIYLPGGGRLPLIAMIMLAVFAIGIVLLHFTRFGTNVYALGGSRASTALMGVRVAPTIIRVYILSSVLAGLSGIVFSFYTAAGYALSAVGVELDTIAAVVIGGTLLTGGSGFMFGTLMGLMIQGLIQTYITFDGNLSSWWTKIVTGLLLFAFITFQQTMVRLAKRPAALAEGAMS
jgi:ribose/xylose/arabinose/galactoside ABC-type transport system permease subunit